ncbi:zinc metalloproteinase nas-13 isoform X2 [Chelonus insularis]|uniref:zinc metalloproteinase nas-13 isoform X2 n=1 Tax=Chelonus insularis TaxID=460826 RepID=UPI0015896FC6|nr:zinc metalloproteinase nas-13 isoform X2 [Chelonus insularis]
MDSYCEVKDINHWSDNDSLNVWELSGLFEGDIVINDVDTNVIAKNGLVNKTMQWTYGIIPYMINSDNFDENDIEKIQKAIAEFHSKTCLKFRPYNEFDINFIVFQADGAGCYSSVGKQAQYQIINLQKPNCLKHGTIVHEILHAVGFYHQQSTFDRDEHVKIYWNNIKSGKEHNFRKYTSDIVTDYDVGYDYKSIMHYSSKAFSKNGNITIAPMKENTIIGQRKKMSKKDLLKLQIMYKDECERRSELTEDFDFPLIIIN